MRLRIGEIEFENPGVAIKLSGTKIPTFAFEWRVIEGGLTEVGGHLCYSVTAPTPMEFDWYVSVSDNVIEARAALVNKGDQDVLLDWISPFWCGRPFDGKVAWPSESINDLKMVRQSMWMGKAGVDLLGVNSCPPHWPSLSYWSTLISPTADETSLALGIANRANTQQRIGARVMGGQLDIAFESSVQVNRQGRPYRLRPGQRFEVQPIAIVVGSTRSEAADRYMQILSDACPRSNDRRSYGGVFSGYGMSARNGQPERISDAAFIRNMAEVMRDLRATDYGLSYFKTQFSRYSTGPYVKFLDDRPPVLPDLPPDKIPQHIINHGFVADDYDLAERAPDGVKVITDHLRSCGFIPAFDSRPFLNLDSTDPNHDAVVAELYGRIVAEWGYDYLMFDFVSSDFESSDDSRTMSEAIADRFQAIRDRVGEDVFLEACMCPPGPVFGIADGFRPAGDWRPGFEGVLASEFAARYYYHNSVILEDMEYLDASSRPACWDIWNNRAVHSLERVRMMVSLSAITGYSTLIGGFLEELSAERWRIFTRCLPVVGDRGEPVDYPDNDPPRIWQLPRQIGHSSLLVLAVFNWDEGRDARISLGDYISVNSNTLIFDFWRQELLGTERSAKAVELGSMQCSVFFVTDSDSDIDAPKYVGTNRHVLGDPGIQELEWEGATNTLRGAVQLHGDEEVSLFFFVPATLTPDWDEVVNCGVELHQHRLVRVDISGVSGSLAKWEIPFRTDHYGF